MFLVDAPDCDWMPFLFGTVAYIALPFWIFDAAGTHTLRRVSLMPLPQTDRRVRSSVCVCVQWGKSGPGRKCKRATNFPSLSSYSSTRKLLTLLSALPLPPSTTLPFSSAVSVQRDFGSNLRVGIHVSAPKCNTHSTLLRRLDRFSFARAPKMPESFLTFPSPLSLSPSLFHSLIRALHSKGA